MDMSLWSHHYKLYQYEGLKGQRVGAIPDMGFYYNWVANINFKIPYITTYFDFSKIVSSNGLHYGTCILPRYGPQMNLLLTEYMASSTLDIYTSRILDYSNGSYYHVDYVNIGGCHIYGVRQYSSEDYTTGHTSIIVYAPATGFDGTNTNQKIIVTFSPTDAYESTNGINGMIVTTKSSIKHYYTNIENRNQRGVNRGNMFIYWLNPNYGKTEQYILNPLAVDGLYTDKVFTIDGGLEPLPHLTKMNLGGTNYLILNKHIAIKYT